MGFCSDRSDNHGGRRSQRLAHNSARWSAMFTPKEQQRSATQIAARCRDTPAHTRHGSSICGQSSVKGQCGFATRGGPGCRTQRCPTIARHGTWLVPRGDRVAGGTPAHRCWSSAADRECVQDVRYNADQNIIAPLPI